MKLRLSLSIVGMALVTLPSFVIAQDLQKGMEAYYNLDDETARQELLPLSNSGNPKAQAIIGRMQMKGWAFPVDAQEGLRLCKESANQGEALGEHCIGNAYYDGIGVIRDYAEAVKWYKKAADKGLEWAEHNMGLSYYLGEGVTQDYAEALKWFQKAADKGNKQAIQFLKENKFPGTTLGSAAQAENDDGLTNSDQSSDFDSYINRIQMQCIGENGITQFSVEGKMVTIGVPNDLPMGGKVDGKIIKKNSDGEQYIVNLGFGEYFIDFEKKAAVYNFMGMKVDLECF